MYTTEPFLGVVLAEIPLSDSGTATVEKSYTSLSWAVVIKLHPDDVEKYGYLLNRRIHFRLYKDDCRVKNNNKREALIEIKDILGSSYEEKR